MAKQYDVIVWGASGFTGRLAAAYLASAYGVHGDVRWAIGGRNEDKLRKVAGEIGVGDVDVITGDASDAAALSDIAGRTKVVLTTVGPYQNYGSEMVSACAQAGTDYVDLCGEPPWMRRMIDAHDAAAKRSGARIVHSCGFDSIPFDLGVYFVQSLARAKFAKPAQEVKGRMMAMRGGMSGGTAASAVATIEAAMRDKFVRDVMQDIYSLAPDESVQRPRQPDQRRPRYDRDIKKWVAPFIMADINARNVHRSNMLMDYAYGEDFQYTEMMAVANAPAAYMVAGALGGFAGAMLFAPTRALMKGVILPKPGDGPDEEQREKGFFKAMFIAKEGGQSVRALVSGDRDPGYGSTCKMLSEAALCLARDVGKAARPGGVMTPAAAMGDALIARLTANAGLTFEAA